MCPLRILHTSSFVRTILQSNTLNTTITQRQINIAIKTSIKQVHGRHYRCLHIAQSEPLHSGHGFTFKANFVTNKFTKIRTVLGIETSCDDTGAAVVDEKGNILGEALHSQIATHNETGGIIPNVAKELHAQNVESVVQRALELADMQLRDVEAIAVTVKPGLIMSLRVGLRHAQKLASLTNQHLIPIHHMEAHALTARMIHRIDFPFLVLLVSGGHCLLAVARDIDDFLLLGSSQDTAPGEAYDKTARELKLNSLPQFKGMSGGAVVELMAKDGDHTAFPPFHVMSHRASCDFSFSGVKISARRQILEEYSRLGLPLDEVLPNAADLCAWFQHSLMYHLARRIQRAFVFVENSDLIGRNKTLVVSGGVASNEFIRANLQHLCSHHDYALICPPQKLCTDNGIMIAWNGMEKVLSGRNYFQDADSLDVQARAPFGVDISKDVTNCSIKLPKLRLLGSS